MTFSAQKAPAIIKKQKQKNASAKSVVLEGTTEMFLFVRGQEGKKTTKMTFASWKRFRIRHAGNETAAAASCSSNYSHESRSASTSQ